VVAFSFDDFGGIIDHPPLLRLSFHTARIHVDAWCQNQYFDDDKLLLEVYDKYILNLFEVSI
jgi:hypothetical protein